MQRKEFEDRVCNFIVQEALVQPDDGVVIGVSGGADSVALLRFFDHVKERLQISIRCVHVEHGIRGDESLRDQYFVEELCRTYGIAETSVAVGEQIAQAIKAHAAVEEMARTARYQALIQEAEAWEKEMGNPVHIAVAHHADDNGETMLFHLARGTGIDGMRGMPVRRERIIRPFLVVTRQEIEVYLEELQQTFCEDSSNTDLQYDRNRLRHQVMPELQKINAQAIEHLGREALYLGQVADYIKKEAAKHLKTAQWENVLLAERVISQPALCDARFCIYGCYLMCREQEISVQRICREWSDCYLPRRDNAWICRIIFVSGELMKDCRCKRNRNIVIIFHGIKCCQRRNCAKEYVCLCQIRGKKSVYR